MQRAMAIIFVLIGHGLQWLTNSNLNVLNWGGGVGVAIFLILSGYGLTESYLSEGRIDSKKFWKKRICTVMIPYWIIMVIQKVLDRILFKRYIGVKETLLSIIGYNDYTRMESIDSTMWYITFFCFPLGVLISLCGGDCKKI